jgi:hypothetical protein
LADVVSGFGGATAKLPTNQIAQSGEFLSGLGYRVGSFAKPFFRSDGDRERISVNLIAAAGAIGSFRNDATPTAYKLPDAAAQPQQLQLLCSLLPDMFTPGKDSSGNSTGCTNAKANYDYLAFRPRIHNQYFRQGYVGIRLISQDDCVPYLGHSCTRAGARLDATFGENEAVTNGTFRHPVWRFEAFYPINLKDTNPLNGVLYFFGSAYIQTVRSKTSPLGNLVLAPADSAFNQFTSKTYYQDALPSFRDYYRLGFGIDFYRLVSNYLNKSQAESGKESGDTTAAGSQVDSTKTKPKGK